MAAHKDSEAYVYCTYRYRSTSEAMLSTCRSLNDRMLATYERKPNVDFSEAFNVVLTNLEVLGLYEADQWIRIVTDYEVFSGEFRRSPAHTTEVHRVLRWLIESMCLGEVDGRRIFKGTDGPIHLPFAYSMTDRWRELISDQPICKPEEIVRNSTYAMVQLRNKTKQGKGKAKKTYNVPITDEHRQTYSELIEGTERLLSACDALWTKTRFTVGDMPLLPAKFFMNRIFSSGRFDQGGRFYCPQQNMPSKQRQHLCFNEEPTIEIDFKSIHPTLLYQLKGLSFNGDPYEIDGYDRDLIKTAFSMLVNITSTASKPSAKSMGNSFTKQFEFDAQESQALTNALFEKHDAIKEYFGTGYGLTLQYIDSRIAFDVMHHFVEVMNQPIFMLHDSAIVSVRHVEMLKIVMAESYSEVVSDVCQQTIRTEDVLSFFPKCLEVKSANFNEALTEMIEESLSGVDFNKEQWDVAIKQSYQDNSGT